MGYSCPEICLMLTWASWRYLRQTTSKLRHSTRASGACRTHKYHLSGKASHSILRLHLALD